MTELVRVALPKLRLWLDSRLMLDTGVDSARCRIKLVSLATTSGRESWDEDCSPGTVSLELAAEHPSDATPWKPGATLAASLYQPAGTQQIRPDERWLGVWDVREVTDDVEDIDVLRTRIRVTGTDLLARLAATILPEQPSASPVALLAALGWRTDVPDNPLQVNDHMRVRTDDDITASTVLDRLRSAAPTGTISTSYATSDSLLPPWAVVPREQDLPAELEHGWAAAQVAFAQKQTRHKGAEQRIDMCQVLAGSMTFERTDAAALDRVTVSWTRRPLLAAAEPSTVQLSSTDLPTSGPRRLVRGRAISTWLVDRGDAFEVGAWVLLAAQRGGWQLPALDTELSLSLDGRPVTGLDVRDPWDELVLTGPISLIAPEERLADGFSRWVSGVRVRIEGSRHDIGPDSHIVSYSLSDPRDVAQLIRWDDLTIAGTTYNGAHQWAGARRSFAWLIDGLDV